MSSVIEKVVQGDRQAILEFYRTFAPKIHVYLSRRLPRKEDAQEILNDVFLDALDSLPLLKDKSNVQSWLYRIARNKTVDFYRKRKIKSVLFSQVPYLEIAASKMAEPEFQFEKNKVRDKIENTMDKLSHQYKKILRLHYEDGVKVKDIAAMLNLSFKATESLLFRARMGFKKTYGRT
ncbi:MAG: RNA polymerase sigma factor [Candidatus Levybacteria bacterium]|nr:RNA polymerase sigma factor [Candidatus Levybacteria bacterium]